MHPPYPVVPPFVGTGERQADRRVRPVVVASPMQYTGGPEALHQLDHALRAAGVESRILYWGKRDELAGRDFARRYGSRESSAEPDPEAVLIIPEIENPRVWRARGWSRIVVWWLAASRLHPLAEYDGCFHIFQSRHAAEQRAAEAIRGWMVTDYLRSEYFAGVKPVPVRERARLIACNHRSAAWLAQAAPGMAGFKFEVIENCPPDRVTRILGRSRYFVDVGWHPGRDRMPREAAMLGCVVLCGRQGAAAYPEDMPLAEELRLVDHDPRLLAACVSDCERNLEQAEASMGRYRAWINGQEATFRAEVDRLVDDPDGPWRSGKPGSCPRPGPDPVPGLNRELFLARRQLSRVGVEALRLGQGKTFGAMLQRLENRLRRWKST